MLPVQDLKACTLNPHVRHLCKDSNTRVRTDGARSNYELGGDFIWEPCDHKFHWVAPEGLHRVRFWVSTMRPARKAVSFVINKTVSTVFKK